MQADSTHLDPSDAALTFLLYGDTRRAIATLELAARDPATRRTALADLSAAYLARFEDEGDCLDLLRAIHAAERVLTEQPADSAARFNRATALSLLGARHLAIKAWREIGRDARDGWNADALMRLRELQELPVDERWLRALSSVDLQSITRSELDNLTSQFPAHARAYGEEVLLPRWAAAVASDNRIEAERCLRLAGWIGETLARTRDEHLLSDAVTAVSRVMDNGPAAQRAALLQGLQQFGIGVSLFHQQNVASAKTPLDEAAAGLSTAANPLSLWARVHAGVVEYYSNTSRGLAMVADVLHDTQGKRYPAAIGRAEWVAGTADKVQGRLQSSVHRYERAAINLRRSGGEPAAAFVSVLLAESYTLLGEHSMAWSARKGAFRQVALSEGARRNVAMWSEAKEALLRQGSLYLAGPLIDEAIAYAESEEMPISRATVHLDRAVYKLESGDRSAALSSLQQAEHAISQMEASGLRDQMTYLALIAEGLCTRSQHPAKAAELLRRGLEAQQATGTSFDAITYTTALADAEISAGDYVAGAATLERAISIFEGIRATVEDPVSRMYAFRQAQPAFDRLMELKTTLLPADDEELFRLAERSRARVLLDMAGGKAAAFVTLGELQGRLPRGVALVSYVVLDDFTLVWVVEDTRTRRLRLRRKRAEVETAIEKFRLRLASGDTVDAINEAAAPLYDMLIRPLNLSIGGKSLIVVPDRSLVRLPFAALFDRDSGEYLIEKRAVTLAPSATLLLRKADTPVYAGSARLRALAIAVSMPGSHRGMVLDPLPHALREATSVASLYEKAIILRDEHATRENFLRLSLSSDVIHFAGHAVVDLDAPRRSVVLFGAPSGDSLQPLSLGELFDAGLGNASLVVLSACRAQDSAADEREGLLGLAGAFVAGGVRQVVASSLDVDDSLSLIVMSAFHRRYGEQRSAGTAFRAAVLGLLSSGPTRARSPAAWGGFTVIEQAIAGGAE